MMFTFVFEADVVSNSNSSTVKTIFWIYPPRAPKNPWCSWNGSVDLVDSGDIFQRKPVKLSLSFWWVELPQQNKGPEIPIKRKVVKGFLFSALLDDFWWASLIFDFEMQPKKITASRVWGCLARLKNSPTDEVSEEGGSEVKRWSDPQGFLAVSVGDWFVDESCEDHRVKFQT